MKTLIQKIVIICIVFCLLLCCACQGEETVSSNDNPLIPESMTEERYNELRDYIYECEPEWHTDEFQQYSAEPHFYACSLAASDKMCIVGIEGIPIMVDLALNDEHFYDRFPRDYLLGGMYVILRIDSQEALGCAGSYVHLECIRDFYLLSQKECPKIIRSKKNTEEKITELRRYGVLALPYVIKQIDKGHEEYISFFTEIGLHLSHRDFAHLALLKHHGYDTLYDDEEYSAGAEDFDYKVWLSENEEDLDNLFKFLDAYCAEYEAEMAKG